MNYEIAKQNFVYNNGKLYKKLNLNEPVGYVENTGYIRVSFEKKLYMAHRIIFLLHNGYCPKYLDHIDNNPLNNNIENLREATPSQNMQNKKVAINNTSGAKGVTKRLDRNKEMWRVRVMVNKKPIHIGYFDDFELAELVAIEARNKYHKEFANHGNA